MYLLKKFPEDFVVIENTNLDLKNMPWGQYGYFTLRKINCTTVDAVGRIASAVHLPARYIGFAGNKDRHAVTTQLISVLHGTKSIESISFENIKLSYCGNGNKPISLGDLLSNTFQITLRNLTSADVKQLRQQQPSLVLPNYFGPQRFSAANPQIGKRLVKKKFNEAVALIVKNHGKTEECIRTFLKKNPNNWIGALRLVPFKTRRIFIHAYQSLLWNMTLAALFSDDKAAELSKQNLEIPLLGFGYFPHPSAQVQHILEAIMKNEEISPRDFIISPMPEISSEGTLRSAFMPVTDFKIIPAVKEHDTSTITVTFTLPKGSYATVVVDLLLEGGKHIQKNWL